MRKKALALSMVLAAAVTCIVGCAPQEASTTGGSEDTAARAPVVETVWSADSDCGSCHEFEAASAGDGTTLYSLHAQHESYSECVDCHVDNGGALAQAHEGYADPKARLPKKLKDTSVSEETCLSSGCHSLDGITAATASSTVLTDSNGTVVNPHEILVDEVHVANSKADLACSSCHKMHAEKGMAPEATAEAAQKKCTGCHHQNVYECGTCHE